MMRYRTMELSAQHEQSYSIFSAVQTVMDIGISSMATGTAVLAGLSGTDSSLIVILSLTSVVLKAIEHGSGLQNRILEYYRSAQNYQYLTDEIRKVMSLKRETHELKDAVDLLSDMFMVMGQNSIPVMSCISSRFRVFIPPVPPVPPSPWKNDLPVSDSFDWDNFAPGFQVVGEHPKLCERHLNVGYFVTGVDGALLHANPSLLNLFGVTRQDFIGPSGIGWITRLYPEDAFAMVEGIRTAVRRQRVWVCKFRVVNELGTVLYFVLELVPLRAPNTNFSGMAGMVVNLDRLVWEELNLEEVWPIDLEADT